MALESEIRKLTQAIEDLILEIRNMPRPATVYYTMPVKTSSGTTYPQVNPNGYWYTVSNARGGTFEFITNKDDPPDGGVGVKV